MADRLARIYGTEDDRVNCPFYHKSGSCRHGDKCSRLHNKPIHSQSLVINHLYQNPLAKFMTTNYRPTPEEERKMDEDFENFFIDIFDEVSKFGLVTEMHVADNLADHIVGNVYVKFEDEEDAQKCLESISNRYYNGEKINAEYCPVTDFDQARCRQYDDRKCNRAGLCNFLHMRRVPRDLLRDLISNQERYGLESRSRSRSYDSRDSDDDRYRSRDRYDRKRSNSRSRSPDSRRDRDRDYPREDRRDDRSGDKSYRRDDDYRRR